MLVSDAPLAPLATPLAIALAALFGALAIAVVARRRGFHPGRTAAALTASPPAAPSGSEI